MCLGWGKGVVSEKAENGGKASDCGDGFVAFPIVNSGRVIADLLRNRLLEDAKVKATLADVAA
jgi:hypothetical protein